MTGAVLAVSDSCAEALPGDEQALLFYRWGLHRFIGIQDWPLLFALWKLLDVSEYLV